MSDIVEFSQAVWDNLRQAARQLGMREVGAMYERFTDRARKVMQLANQEAHRFNHDHVSPEHILVGMIKEGAGVACNVLKNMDVDVRKVRLAIEALEPSHPDAGPLLSRLPLSILSHRLVERSIVEAKYLGHNYVGTEHLLLAAIHPEGGNVTLLGDFGVTAERVRRETLELLGQIQPYRDEPDGIVEEAVVPKMGPAEEPQTTVAEDVADEIQRRMAATTINLRQRVEDARERVTALTIARIEASARIYQTHLELTANGVALCALSQEVGELAGRYLKEQLSLPVSKTWHVTHFVSGKEAEGHDVGESAVDAKKHQDIAERLNALAAHFERQACAQRLLDAINDWPDNPQIRALLRSHAEGILERGRAGEPKAPDQEVRP